VHRLISRKLTAIGDFADFQGASEAPISESYGSSESDCRRIGHVSLQLSQVSMELGTAYLVLLNAHHLLGLQSEGNRGKLSIFIENIL
jgi:hypothetical protein